MSPDGTRVAVDVIGPEGGDIWIHDLSRGTETILTTDPADDYGPLWTPDGEWVVFTSTREGQVGAFQKRVDTPGDAERLMAESEGSVVLQSTSWSADGQTLIFWEISGTGAVSTDIGLLSMEGDRARELLLDTEFSEAAPAVSPDGGWIAYHADVAGQFEVYVERFPSLGDRQQISTNGGRHPRWSPDGRELFYRRGGSLLAVPITPGPPFRAGAPTELFAGPYRQSGGTSRPFDLAPDGERFLLVRPGGQTAADNGTPRIIFVERWLEELERLVPTP